MFVTGFIENCEFTLPGWEQLMRNYNDATGHQKIYSISF